MLDLDIIYIASDKPWKKYTLNVRMRITAFVISYTNLYNSDLTKLERQMGGGGGGVDEWRKRREKKGGGYT